MDKSEDNQNSLRIFMLPWLAHGHITPYLELAKRLTKRNIFIYLCSTQINLKSITGKLKNNYSSSIQLVELHLPSSPDLPPDLHTTNGLPPHLMNTLLEAFNMSDSNLLVILKEIKPDIVIHELMHPWVGELAASLDIPAVGFLTNSATAICYFFHMAMNPGIDFPIPGVYLNEREKTKLLAQAESSKKNMKHKHNPPESTQSNRSIILIKTFREIEVDTMDYLSSLMKTRLIPVGFLTDDLEDSTNELNNSNSEIIEWLGKKDKNSTVFVSFGSEYFLSNEEMEEIAYGLELSEINFIWVVRFPKKEGDTIRIEDELPEGFLDRVGERGKIIEGWAPQMAILRHESVGGFVSHCGWGSVTESIKFGVPIIAMPMHLDQPLNARHMVSVGVAVEVVRDETGKVHREEVAKVIRQVVVDENGEDIRKKVRKLSEKLRSKLGDEEIDVLVQELSLIYVEKKNMKK